MRTDTLILLLLVCISFVCIFLVSAPGQKFVKALKSLRRLGNGERRNDNA